ncbi:mitochondrial ATPase [Podospora fimiseda]|uniref:Mitochondrial ATPase n=1 Tax=Podospora fimiseda TaxID=252190 RepID=A0AAN7H2G8_9PEZI|nr:mitochondrial ATPase [Podospora fimiseda]
MITRTAAAAGFVLRTGIQTSRPAPAVAAIACLLCQHQQQQYRLFSNSSQQLNSNNSNNNKDALRKIPGLDGVPPSSPLANAPRSYGEKTLEFTPTPLSRPIGMNYPPEAGQNTGVDNRSIRERRDDFANYDKQLAKRQNLISKWARPYFRDWRNMRFHKGKTFLCPPRLFKCDLSLYFPNLHGRTLSGKKAADTTPVLEGRVSIVALFSGMWAENQVKTFISPEKNPGLEGLLKNSGGKAQLIHINVEEDPLKYWLVRLFSGSIKRKIGRENWDKYFLVKKGISDEIRESIGLLNSKVGYVYLVDHECRIRWAASGDAELGEPEGLIRGVGRILEEIKEKGIGANYTRKQVVGKRTQ